eukprot:TRINITY_DN46130_c0_g1_i1.p1 TRINITY_DN46130_c0_g1~~TRINITY_DN46130_c0_g1_i1.p1  ORF type:complete len:283 (+),score=50.28 TRINITY_DN46130_c0_g1_i1:113-850(+)
MYPDHFVEDDTAAGVAFQVLTDNAFLRVSLPAHYPCEEPQLSLSCPGGIASIVEAAVLELESIAREAVATEMECCAELLDRFLQLAEGILAPQEAPTESATDPDVPVTTEDEVSGHDGNDPIIPEYVKALVTNVHNNKCKVYIGRPDANPKGRGGKPTSGHPRWGWGNPFSMGGGASRGSVIRQYTKWIMAPERVEMRSEARRELQGKTLGCFCVPLSCHGHVLALIANSEGDDELGKYFPEMSR